MQCTVELRWRAGPLRIRCCSKLMGSPPTTWPVWWTTTAWISLTSSVERFMMLGAIIICSELPLSSSHYNIHINFATLSTWCEALVERVNVIL